MSLRKTLRTFLSPPKKILFWKVQKIKIEGLKPKIHLIRTDTIGDFVLFTAILPSFQKLYPKHEIVLIVDTVCQQLAEWLREQKILGEDKDNYFAELLSIDSKLYNRNLFYYYKTLKKLRLSAPEVVIQPIFSRSSKTDELTLISKESQKIGYKGDLSNIKSGPKKRSDEKYDCLIQNPKSCLEPEKNKHFLNELAGYEFLSSGIPRWELTERLLSEGRDFLKSFGVDLLKPYLAIFPSAGYEIRHWPIEKFVSLILKLFRCKPSLQFILIGGSRDKKTCLQIEKTIQMKNLPIYNLCGKTKLSELAKILAVADLYIGNETGAMHMASAVGTSTICLLGGGHYGRFFPYPAWKKGTKNIVVIHKMDCFNCNWQCKHKIKKRNPAPCIKNIKVHDVYNQAINILGQ